MDEHYMLPGSHERATGPECSCGWGWGRWNDACISQTKREDFTEQFREAVDGMRWEDIARACRTSIITVQRWHDGKSTPHLLGRPSVFAAIQKFRSDNLT